MSEQWQCCSREMRQKEEAANVVYGGMEGVVGGFKETSSGHDPCQCVGRVH